MPTSNILTQEEQIFEALYEVKDPEIPVISVVDLGIIPKVSIDAEGCVVITMTPTFTACPATQVMQNEIIEAVESLDFVSKVIVKVDFTTPWTSDNISETGRQQLKEFGLAPPNKHHGKLDLDMISDVHCPHCGSDHTSLKILFGATLCRSTHFCYDCKQAFEAFKPV
ncbi:MAG: 1,2-phenylacetyl-CoA epoxidase subunit PaaD [Chitinophagales bacterium]